MGSNKARLPYRGGRFIEAVRLRLYRLFDEVLVVTNTPEHYSFLGGSLVQDIHCGMGVLGGLHAGLAHSRTSHIFAVACDMPCLNEVAAIDPGFDSFRNVPPPEDYFALRGCEAFGLPPARDRRA